MTFHHPDHVPQFYEQLHFTLLHKFNIDNLTSNGNWQGDSGKNCVFQYLMKYIVIRVNLSGEIVIHFKINGV